MEFTAKTIADFLQGTVEGNPEAKVDNVSPIEDGKEGSLSFLANPKYAKFLYTTKASIVLVSKDFAPEQKVNTTLVRVEDAYKSFAMLLDLYQQALPQKTGIDAKASISESANVGENCYVGDFAFIGDNCTIGNNVKIYPQVYIGDNVKIGDNTTLFPGVKIYIGCIVGKDCIIHAGTVIGSDGFGFAPSNGSFKKIPQLGIVIIEDDVEVGSNCSIDRATMGATILRKGVKLDNLIQIAHNVEVGENTVMAGQSGIAGSVKVGANCMFGGQTAVAGHITIANGVKIGAQSGVANNVKKEGVTLFGSPAFDFREATRSIAAYKDLGNIVKRLNQLEQVVKKINENN
jgi:UDP-3-O-[3-hydroxymyristoyl] glucosamine N-acyltransferase